MSVIRNILSITFRQNAKSSIKFKNFSTISSYILKSDLPDVPIPKISISEFVLSKCEKFDRFVASECAITGRKYSYGDLLKKSKNFSRALRKKLGLKDGDVIAILLPNIPEYPLVVLGALCANLIVTTINPLYTNEEISRQLDDSSSKAIITLVSSWETASGACALLKKTLPIITIKTESTQSLPRGAIDFREFTDNEIDCVDPPPSSPDDVAILPYSSGTTGLPKGVQLTNYNIVANLCQNNSHEIPLIEETTDSHQDVIPIILPLFHIYGFTVNNLYTLTKGAKQVMLPKFTPDDYVSVLRKHKPDILSVVPPIVLFLTAHPMVKPQDLQSVRTVFSGAAPLGALDEQKFLDKAGKNIHIMQGYGLTETSPGVTTITIKLKTEVNVSGSIGRPLPNTLLKIINPDDPTGTPLGPNTPGELLVKGPQVMKGYHNRPEETKNAFLNTWFRTGDIMYYNHDRILFVTDRLKELIKVKGFQVAPAELEEIIRNHPNVEEAAVIGIPHPTHGEVPRAYIVPKKDSKIDTKDVQEHVKTKVAEYKQLKGGVAIVDTIPKNASGKILRRTLKLEYEQKGK